MVPVKMATLDQSRYLFRRIYLTQNRCTLLLEMLWPRAFERSPKMMFILGYRAVRKAKYSSLWIRSCYAK
ncbi:MULTISPECIES: hypothetical protein [unclassified Brucella]|uniref:hypothetical protein n=1 Tax=unclassified Brucella TaxID=2632610 RepID=UPI002877A5C4|nr:MULTISPECIES: hypothetical protein [unclassified Brucella]